MSATTPCLRHTARRWLASCDACTAWQLTRQIAARDAATTQHGAVQH